MDILLKAQRNVVVYHDNDINEYASRLGLAPGSVAKLSAGSFSGSTKVLNLGAVSLVLRKASSRYFSRACFDSNIVFFFPLDQAQPCINGVKITPSRQVATAQTLEFSNIFPENAEHLLVMIRLECLPDFLTSSQTAEFLTCLKAASIRQCCPERRAQAGDFLLQMMRNIETYEDELPELCTQIYSQFIIDYLYDYQCRYCTAGQKQANNKERILCRALKCITAKPDIQVSELSQSCYTSKRTLQYAFEELLGVSPKKFCKQYRLNCLYDELWSASISPSVNDLACRHNFSNVGRLIREYQEYFGEHPINTYQRACLLRERSHCSVADESPDLH